MTDFYDTAKILAKYFPNAFKNFVRWKHLSPTGFNTIDTCPCKFFCRYFSGIKIPQTPVMLMGERCHAMKERYYKTLDVKKLLAFLQLKPSEDAIQNWIFRYFNTVQDEGEILAMKGFASIEARRIGFVIEGNGLSLDVLKRFYMPMYSEIELKKGHFSGRIDCIYRQGENKCVVLDWKDGFSRPWLPENYDDYFLRQEIQKQGHVYIILVNDSKLMDDDVVLTCDQYYIVYPRHATVVPGHYSRQLEQSIRVKAGDYLNQINAKEFPMRVSEKTCGFHLPGKFTCDYYDPFCEKIIDQM